MTRQVTVAAIQRSFTADVAANVDATEAAVREAASLGAQIILPSELFESLYFPQRESPAAFALAAPFEGHPTLARFRALARELGVVIPTSYFEKAGQAFYNSLAVIDADGALLGNYRKSHIPDGPGYEEKYYFAPGDTGFRVWDTAFGRIGVGICWDQWYPEAARAMVLAGAELLFYPTAIGTEPEEPDLETKGPWQRVMQGHAVANCVPIIASNRWGSEDQIRFHGASFIADALGALVAEAGGAGDATLTHRFDLDANAELRASWGFFRDRRPDLYGTLLTRDGVTRIPGAG
jgi:N-carbamoylputrescine amidase